MEFPLKLEEKIEILKSCTFLGGAEEEILGALAEKSSVQQIAEGNQIIRKGDPGTTMYFIASGKVLVHDQEVVLTHLSEGEVFGEMAVLDSDVRSASVTAEQETSLLSLERDDLWQVISTSPNALKTIIAAVLQRERNIVHDVTSRTEQLLSYEKELEIGRRIQADFLPEFIPEVENWEISSYFEAAREVAGDFYDVFELKPTNNLAIVIGDVCDKGVGAALFMALFRSLFRATCQYGVLAREKFEDNAASSDYIRELLQYSIDTTNRYISSTHSKSSMFASVFFGVLNPDSGEMIYVNGGHESPIIFSANGGHEVLELTGGVLGLFPFAKFSIASTRLKPGDLLFAYTDGVNEARNESGDQFTDERILEAGLSMRCDSGEFVDEILDQVRTFRGAAAQSDDITMLAIKSLY